MRGHTSRTRQSWPGIACVGLLLGMLGVAIPTHAANFLCAVGDVGCLIDSVTQANGNGEPNTITLEAGTYTLTAVNNDPTGARNGLPVITGNMTIQGAGMDATILEAQPPALL